ncbi:MAG: sugar phosphate isomerase/epimerase [Bdellovibrionota bacterium]
MQGRLSPKPSDRIQAFPRESWREEFERAQSLEFECIELIYDELYLVDNPLVSVSGRQELMALSKRSGIALASICADYFMIHKLVERDSSKAKGIMAKTFELLEIARQIKCPLVEFPFVDSSSLQDPKDRTLAVERLALVAEKASELGLRIAVETDLAPVEFRNFLNQLPKNVGANLDLGNSAALGYDALSECRAFGDRILNVHIKDRMLGGTTVPLLSGNTDFERAFKGLKASHYNEDFILQTAPSEDYLGAAAKYRRMVKEWINNLCS